MKKTFLMPLVLACTVMIFASAAVSQTEPDKLDPLVGVIWSGTDSDGDKYDFTFEKDGTLAYTSPSGSYRNGKWRRFNNSVYFEMNDHYSEYLGEMRSNVIEGMAWNIDDHQWRWKITIVSPLKK